jgi:hypothetical protein
MSTVNFYDAQPDPVRALIELAELSRDGYPEQAARIAAVGWPGSSDTFAEIVDLLGWINRLETEDGASVLRAFWGSQTTVLFADQAADRLADDLRADVIYKAARASSVRGLAVNA